MKLLSIRSGFFLLIVMMALACRTSFATGEPGSDSGAPMKIIEVNAVRITVDVGHDNQQTYKINDFTKTTLDGFPARPGDLRPGMDVLVTLNADKDTVVDLAARDPKK